MKKVLLVLLVLCTALILFGCDELIADFQDVSNGIENSAVGKKEETISKKENEEGTAILENDMTSKSDDQTNNEEPTTRSDSEDATEDTTEDTTEDITEDTTEDITEEFVTSEETTTFNDELVEDLFVGEIAQAVIYYENEIYNEIERLKTSNPEYIYSFIPVNRVYCSYTVGSALTANELVNKHNMEELFYKGDVHAYDRSKVIYISFDRDDFTQNVYDMLCQISREEANIRDLDINFEREYDKSYMPKIEFYADTVTPIDYEKASSALVFMGEESLIVRTKEEYDSYVEQLLSSINDRYIIDLVNNERSLYTEEFFEENVLVITDVFGRGSSSVKISIDNVYVSSNKLYVVVHTKKPLMQTEDVVNYVFQIIVSKSDIANCDEVIVLN